jgi:SsrA-binding protein
MKHKLIAENRKAYRDYFILEKYEAGIELKGTEVKSLREGNLSLRSGYARAERGELFLYDVHIPPYSSSGYADHEPTRPRKLLLHKSEMRKMVAKQQERGLTLVPLAFYFNHRGIVKVNLALAKGRKFYDKRETIKKKIQLREMQVRRKRRRR